jgi:hypothetical protein
VETTVTTASTDAAETAGMVSIPTVVSVRVTVISVVPTRVTVILSVAIGYLVTSASTVTVPERTVDTVPVAFSSRSQ